MKRKTLLQMLTKTIIRRTNKVFDVIDHHEDNKHNRNVIDSYPTVHFEQSYIDDFLIQHQPIEKGFQRVYGEWNNSTNIIRYFDETLLNKEKRRLILSYEIDNFREKIIWKEFLDETKVFGLDYIEIFTTSIKTDSIFEEMGSWPIIEKPILINGTNPAMNFCIHGIDRENWTNLSSRQI